MTDKEIEPYYRNQAKGIVDTLFDGKVFHDKITRSDLQAMENLIAYLFQSQARAARKTAEIMLRHGRWNLRG